MPRTRSTPSPARPSRRPRSGHGFPSVVIPIAVFAIAFAVHAGSIGHDFVWDDPTLIAESPRFQRVSDVPALFRAHAFSGAETGMGGMKLIEYYRPVWIASLAVDHLLWGERPLGYHVTNVVLHAIAAGLVAWLRPPAPWGSAGRADRGVAVRRPSEPQRGGRLGLGAQRAPLRRLRHAGVRCLSPIPRERFPSPQHSPAGSRTTSVCSPGDRGGAPGAGAHRRAAREPGCSCALQVPARPAAADAPLRRAPHDARRRAARAPRARDPVDDRAGPDRARSRDPRRAVSAQGLLLAAGRDASLGRGRAAPDRGARLRRLRRVAAPARAEPVPRTVVGAERAAAGVRDRDAADPGADRRALPRAALGPGGRSRSARGLPRWNVGEVGPLARLSARASPWSCCSRPSRSVRTASGRTTSR